MANSRSKGKAGELELAKLLRDELGIEVTRNLEQTRNGGHDLMGLPMIALEVKRQEHIKLTDWWLQTKEQANITNRIPVLAYRKSRQPWRFRLPMLVVMPDLFIAHMEPGEYPIPDWAENLEYTTELEFEGFCFWLRENMRKDAIFERQYEALHS